LSGALTEPALQAEAQVPHLTAGPVSLENIQVALKGSPTHFVTEKLTASLGGAPIVGKVEPKAKRASGRPILRPLVRASMQLSFCPKNMRVWSEGS